MLQQSILQNQATQQDELMRRRQREDDERALGQAAFNARATSDREVLKDLLQKSPVTASQYLGLKRANEDAASPVSTAIQAAKNPGEAMDDTAITNQYKFGGGHDFLDSRNIGQGFQSTDNPGGIEVLKSLIAQGVNKRNALQKEAEAPNQFVEIANPDGSTTKLPSNPRTAPPIGYKTGLTGDEKTALEIANINKTAGPKARAGGQYQNAVSAASAAYNPDYFEDEQGNLVGLIPDGKGGFKPANLPPGLHRTGANAAENKPPPMSVVQTNSQGNTAELEGVKLLTTLKQMGLENSNNWMDPKITQWMIAKLGMAPDDPRIADVNQRANFVQAAMLQALMKGRPSQYLAALYNKHIPDATQSPKLLVHQIHKVLQENAEYRLQNQQVYKNLPDPTGGMTYQQWLQMYPETRDQAPTGAGQGKLDALRKQ